MQKRERLDAVTNNYVVSEEFVEDIVWAFYQYDNYTQIHNSPFFKYISHYRNHRYGQRNNPLSKHNSGYEDYIDDSRVEEYFNAITDPREKKIAKAIKAEHEKNHGKESEMNELLAIVLHPYLLEPYHFGVYHDMKGFWLNREDEIVNKDWFVCWAVELLNTNRSFHDLESVVEIYNCICDIIISKSSFVGEVKYALKHIPGKQKSSWSGFEYEPGHDDVNPGVVFEFINRRLKRTADNLCLNQSEYSKDELDNAVATFKKDMREMFTIFFDKVDVSDKERVVDWNFNKCANYMEYMLSGKTVEERELWAEQKITETNKNIENLYSFFNVLADELTEAQLGLDDLNKKMRDISEKLEQTRDFEGWVLFEGSKSVFDEIKRLDINEEMVIFRRELDSLRVREPKDKRLVDSKLWKLTEKQEELNILLNRFDGIYGRMLHVFSALRENTSNMVERMEEMEVALRKRRSSTPLRPVLNKVLKETRKEKEDMAVVANEGKLLQDKLNEAIQFLQTNRDNLVERGIMIKQPVVTQVNHEQKR